MKDEKGLRNFETSPGPPFYEYDGYRKNHAENVRIILLNHF